MCSFQSGLWLPSRRLFWYIRRFGLKTSLSYPLRVFRFSPFVCIKPHLVKYTLYIIPFFLSLLKITHKFVQLPCFLFDNGFVEPLKQLWLIDFHFFTSEKSHCLRFFIFYFGNFLLFKYIPQLASCLSNCQRRPFAYRKCRFLLAPIRENTFGNKSLKNFTEYLYSFYRNDVV